MNKKVECKDLGYKCIMEDKLDTEKVPIYRYEERPEVGSDARPGFTRSVAVGAPIGYEMRYTAYRKCSHCGRREEIGSAKVPIGKKLTFSDFLDNNDKEAKWEEMLKTFDEKQKEERREFIRNNKPNLLD